MGVRLLFLVFSIFIHVLQALDDLPEGSCHNDHLLRGRIGCEALQGHIRFDDDEFECTLEKYGKVKRVDGAIEFVNGTYTDPLACMPLLNLVFLPEESYYKNLTPIKVGPEVRLIQRFTFNDSLAIFNPYKNKTGSLDIDIDSDSYVMDYTTHRKIMNSFGSKRVRVKISKGNGECLLKNRPLKYLTNLDDCIEIRGDLIIDETLVLPKTNARIKKIKGCITIKNTDLKYNQLDFLRHVEHVTCNAAAIITGNKNLCITEPFAKYLESIHVNANDTDAKREWMKTNGNKSICEGVCTSENLEEQKNCKTIWGELQVYKKYKKQLRDVTTIYGRLIIDGLEAEEPFEFLPNLTKIVSLNREPAVKITSNSVLRWLSFPEKLDIATPGQFRIYVDRNLHYRMNKTQYDMLVEKYGPERLNIKHLAENECYLTDPITDFAQIDGCDVIVGDLVLNGKIKGQLNDTSRIAYVTGCIIINGTDFRDLDFLQFLNEKSSQDCRSGHVITHNPRLCANKYVRRLSATRSHTGFYRLTTHSNKPYCYKTCVREDVYQGRLECPYVDDRLMVPTDGTDDFLSSATNVEHLHGTLSIRYTNITRVNSFSHLKSFTLHDDEPAIEIIDNKHLKSVAFPRLDKIKPAKNRSAKLIVIRKNGNYIMPAKQYKRLEDKYGADNLDIDHYELPDFYGYGLAVGIACGTVLGLVCLIALLGAILHRQVRKKKTVAKKKEEQKPLIARDEYEQGNGTAVSVMPPVPAQELTPQDMESMMKGNQEEYIDLAGAEMNEKSSQVTAKTANKLDGVLKVNASMMQREREANKTKVVRSDEEDTKGPMTARTANFGKNFAGNLKDNVSRMSTEKGTSKGKSDGDDERGPATARTANVGMNKYTGAQKENVSRMNTEQLGNKGTLSSSLDSKDRGTLTARTANIGKNYAGAPKENMSQMQKEKTVTKAKSDSDDLGPATARTANIGGGKFVGAPKNTASQMQKEKNSEEKGPETAMTANIGMGKKFEKGNQSVFKNDATAKTGYLPGNKEFTGNIKENKSVMGKAKNEKSPDKKK